MKRILAALIFSLTLIGMSCAIAKSSDRHHKTNKHSWLFVLQGSNATFDAKSNKLTLTNLPLNVIDFSDRPSRSVKLMSMNDLVALWSRKGKNSFQNDPPNAALIFDDGKSPNSRVAILEFSRPSLTDNNLTFDVKIIGEVVDYKGGKKGSMVSITKLPEQMSHASIVIDSFWSKLNPSNWFPHIHLNIGSLLSHINNGGSSSTCQSAQLTTYRSASNCLNNNFTGEIKYCYELACDAISGAGTINTPLCSSPVYTAAMYAKLVAFFETTAVIDAFNKLGCV